MAIDKLQAQIRKTALCKQRINNENCHWQQARWIGPKSAENMPVWSTWWKDKKYMGEKNISFPWSRNWGKIIHNKIPRDLQYTKNLTTQFWHVVIWSVWVYFLVKLDYLQPPTSILYITANIYIIFNNKNNLILSINLLYTVIYLTWDFSLVKFTHKQINLHMNAIYTLYATKAWSSHFSNFLPPFRSADDIHCHIRYCMHALFTRAVTLQILHGWVQMLPKSR